MHHRGLLPVLCLFIHMALEKECAIIHKMDDWEEIFDAIPDMIVILDPQQRIVRCNKAMAQYLGVSTEDLLGDTCYKNLHDAQKPPHNCPFVYMMADGIEHSEEVYIEQIGKEFQVSVSPIFNPSGQVKGCVHVVRDITRRKQAEQALRESENRFRTLFQTMAKGVIYRNQNGKIIDANPAAQRILGLTLEQMQQNQPPHNPPWRTIHQDGSDFPEETHPAMQSLKTGKEVRDVIMGVINPNHQTTSWLLVSAIPQFHPGEDKPFQVFTTFQDITEMKKTQEELQKSQQELRAQLEEIGDLQDILRQQAIRDLLTSIFQPSVHGRDIIARNGSGR